MFDNWLPIMAFLLAYGSLVLCRCRTKTGNDNAVMLLMLTASFAPIFLSDRSAAVFLAAFSFIVFGYFELYYERRLRAIGRLANEMGEMPEQCRLLLLFVGEIAERLCRENFNFYSERIGRRAFLTLAAHPKPLTPLMSDDETLCHALRFIYADITGKWGSPPRSHSVSLLLECMNRNILFYLTTAKSGNLDDIRNAARQNLNVLLAIYAQDFHLQEGNSADLSSATAFAKLRRQFETDLMPLPVRMELA